MPRRALRCIVDLNLQQVTAPGVWLPSCEDVYLSISLFGQYRNTRLVSSRFPILLHEPFRFEKTYYSAVDPADVALFLDDELIVVELIQLSDYCTGGVRLASFSCSARDFLYPYPSLCPFYASGSRKQLMTRSIAFPGISPMLEFTSRAVIKESRSAELDALEDALEEEKVIRRRSRSRSRSRSRARSRSLSRTRTIRSASGVRKSFDDDNSETDTQRPPFVVRHLEKSLIGRTPGEGPLKPQKLKKSKKGKKSSRPSSALSYLGNYYDDYVSYPSYKSKLRLSEIYSDDEGNTLPIYTSKYSDSDEDLEVAALTSTRPYSPLIPPRPRSTSPYLYKSSYSSRFSDRPLSPASEVEVQVARALRRSRSRSRSRSPSRLPARYTPTSIPDLKLASTMENLALDTDLVQSRRYYPRYL